MNSWAATLAASNRLPFIDLLVSMASTAVRRTVGVAAGGLGGGARVLTVDGDRDAVEVHVGVGRDRHEDLYGARLGLDVRDRAVGSQRRRGRESKADRGQRGQGTSRGARKGDHERSGANSSGSTVTLA